jgi:alpha-beta hydrolase superfamily lysophospholipase
MMMTVHEKTILSGDKLKLYVKHWSPVQTQAVICMIHGFGEHINRYNHVASFFVGNDYAIVGMDNRGHGKSEGKRGHAPNYDAYIDDIQLLMNDIKTQYPNKPIFLWGHSMGGNLILNYMLRRKPAIVATVVTGAWIRLAFEPKPMLLKLGRMMRSVLPTFSQSAGLDTNHLSTDKAVVRAYNADSLVHGKITAAAGMGLNEAAAWLNTYQGEVPVPTLIMHGEKDRVISPDAAREFSERVKGDITFKLWHGLYHEIHQEKIKDEVLNYALGWMNKIL